MGEKEKIGPGPAADEQQRHGPDDEKLQRRQLELELRLRLFGRALGVLFDVGLAVECRGLRVCHGWKPRSLCDAAPAHGKALKQAAGADAGPLRATVGW